jgi:hypothetical protein
MTRWTERIILLIAALLLAAPLFGAERDEDYARYLFHNGHYEEAARQYLFLRYRAEKSADRISENRYLYWIARSRLESGEPSAAEVDLKRVLQAGPVAAIAPDEVFTHYLSSRAHRASPKSPAGRISTRATGRPRRRCSARFRPVRTRSRHPTANGFAR